MAAPLPSEAALELALREITREYDALFDKSECRRAPSQYLERMKNVLREYQKKGIAALDSYCEEFGYTENHGSAVLKFWYDVDEKMRDFAFWFIIVSDGEMPLDDVYEEIKAFVKCLD